MTALLFAENEFRQVALTEAAEQHRAVDAMIRGHLREPGCPGGAPDGLSGEDPVRLRHDPLRPFACAALRRLLDHLGRCTDWLGIEPVVPSLGPQAGNTFLDSLLMLSLRRLLTIEVNNVRRAIVQVRGRCNKPPSSPHHIPRMKLAEEMLRRWA